MGCNGRQADRLIIQLRGYAAMQQYSKYRRRIPLQAGSGLL